jgi:hypothetical protein
VRQATVFPILRTCFFGGFRPGSSKRNWLRSLIAWARIKPFCRQCPIVFIETPQALAISEMVSIPRSRSRSNRPRLSPSVYQTKLTYHGVTGDGRRQRNLRQPFNLRLDNYTTTEPDRYAYGVREDLSGITNGIVEANEGMWPSRKCRSVQSACRQVDTGTFRDTEATQTGESSCP